MRISGFLGDGGGAASIRSLTRRTRAKEGAEDDLRAHSRAARLLELLESTQATWFWETDAGGRILYVSPHILKLLRKTTGGSHEATLGDLITERSLEEGQSAQRTLAFYLSTHSAFDAITVASSCFPDLTWALTGRPVTNAVGRFEGFIGWATDLTAQHQSELELNKLASLDALTGLMNRRAITKIAEDSVKSVKKNATRCSLMMLDLDRFKEVNDKFGHAGGDTLLQLVALRLRHVVRDLEYAGRIGGDEFMVVLPQTCDTEALTLLARRIIEALSEPYDISGTKVSIGVSVGISTTGYDDGTATDLIHQADLALYAAKRAGRGLFRFYTPELEQDHQDRDALEKDLRQAIEDETLYVEYQPSVELSSQTVKTCEALVRWNHPERGVVSPFLFVSVAESCGLIRELGQFVLRTACRDAARWPQGVKVAVNLSPVQMAESDMAKTVANILTEAGLPAGRLELEITESVFLEEDGVASRVIQDLTELGVSLALDDFGTGYSSLSYLYKAPFKKIKIDRSFVRSDGPAKLNSAVIQSVVLLAHALNMEVTAEGVESEDELALVRGLGCNSVQGYIFSKPLSDADVSTLLGQQTVATTGLVTARAPRRRIMRAGTLYYDNQNLQIRLRDISRTGALIEGVTDLAAGTVVRLELGIDSALEAEVRWSKLGKAGLSFRADFDLMQLTQKNNAKNPQEYVKPEYFASAVGIGGHAAIQKRRLTVKDLRS